MSFNNYKNSPNSKEISPCSTKKISEMNCTCMYHSLLRYILGIFESLKNVLGLRKDNQLNNNLTLIFVNEGPSDKNIPKCDKMQEKYQTFNVCCKSKNVTNKCSDIENRKPHCCKNQCKTVDICSNSSNHCTRSETNETVDIISDKLSCIIKRFGHLIDTFPSQNNCSATIQSNITGLNLPFEAYGSKLSCNKQPIKNECEKPSQETVIPINSCEMPVKSLTETNVQPTQSNSCCPVDNSSEENIVKPADCNNKLDYELQSIDLCTEVENTNQNLNCNIIDNCSPTNNTTLPAKTLPVKIIKNIAKPITSHQQKQVTCLDQSKVKHSSVKKIINKPNQR